MWVSLDVCSLYTSIPHKVGLQAVTHFLNNNSTLNTQQIDFILLASQFCLEHNYFLFDGEFYLQKQGTAMGANFFLSYANLTMGLWETRCVGADKPFSAHLVFFGRYIDDIIIVTE